MKNKNVYNTFGLAAISTCLTLFGSLSFAQKASKALPPMALSQALQNQSQAQLIQGIIQQGVLQKVDIGRVASSEETNLFKSRAKQGGGDTGGGSVTVCYDSKKQIKSVETYDIYEAKRRYRINPDYGTAKTTEEALSLALSRLYKLDPITAQEITEEVNRFSTDAEILDDANPPMADDLKPIIIPGEDTGCKIVSAILQKRIQFDEEKQYYINGKIWKAMDPIQRASMILHEVLWQRVRTSEYPYGLGDSTGIRYVNARLWSNTTDNIKLEEYAEKMGRHIRADYSFFAHGLLLNKQGHVYSGKMTTNLGEITPVRVTEMSTSSSLNLTYDGILSLKKSLYFHFDCDVESEKLQSCGQGGYPNASFFQIASRGHVVAAYDKNTKTYTLYNPDGEIEGQLSNSNPRDFYVMLDAYTIGQPGTSMTDAYLKGPFAFLDNVFKKNFPLDKIITLGLIGDFDSSLFYKQYDYKIKTPEVCLFKDRAKQTGLVFIDRELFKVESHGQLTLIEKLKNRRECSRDSFKKYIENN